MAVLSPFKSEFVESARKVYAERWQATLEREQFGKVIAVEPSTSAVLSGGAPGAHRMEGMGTGRVVPMWDPSLANGIEAVSTEDAEAMARRLAKEEAIFAGTSTGANVVAAIRVASQMRPDSTVLTIAVDSGLKYVSTELYR